MANTLTGLIEVLYEGLDQVSREMIGFIPAVAKDSKAERAGLNQTVRIPITPSSAAGDISPSNVSPDTGGQILSYADITIDKQRAVPIAWTGEELRAYNEGSEKARYTLMDQFKQAVRTLANEVEADIAAEYTKASRAYGTAGTTPFATSVADAAQIAKILDDNGAPRVGRKMIIDSSAKLNLLGLTQLTQANTAGTDNALRNGIIDPIFGFKIWDSNEIASHTAGTATGFDANGGEPAGETTIVVDGSDSGTILAGDIVSWVGDTNKYVVQSATASGAATGNIVIAKPGLMQTLADTVEGSLGSAYTANMAFHEDAIQLAARIPASPDEGDLAIDRMMLSDPVSGLVFEVSIYPQYRQVHYEVAIAWGVSLIKPEHACILLG
jgi:hypothetical protein